MRFIITTLLCALAAAPAIMALPSAIDLTSSSLVERDVFDNSTLGARTFGHGGRNRDHCQKSYGRRNDDKCGCYPGLHCDNDHGKCECGDQGNARFVFNHGKDDPKCACTGDDQKYDTKEKKCVCKPGFEPSYKQGRLQCKKPSCGKDQHWDGGKKECVCDAGLEGSWQNSKLVCKPPRPTCGMNQEYNNKHKKCECKDGFDASWKNNKLVCTPCQPKCGKHQKYDEQKKKCVCKPGYNGSVHNGHLVCVVCPPSHSKRWEEPRAMETGRPAPTEFRTLEDALGCSAHQTACEIASTWTCFDSSSNLASCGGCPGEGRDCSSIEGVDEVRCAKGQCVIDSCQKGLTVDETAGTCVRQSWSNLLVQL